MSRMIIKKKLNKVGKQLIFFLKQKKTNKQKKQTNKKQANKQINK